MKKFLVSVCATLVLAACGRNEPGTMGGEPGTPRTQATGAPAEAAKDSAVSDEGRSAIQSEHGSSTFENSDEAQSKSGLLPPDASTTNARPLTPANSRKGNP